MRKELFNIIGFFREDFPVCEDYDLWLKVTARFPVGFVPSPLILKYGGHDGQLSTKFVGMDYGRMRSMKSLLNSSHLNAAKKNLLFEKLEHKTSILKAGAKKHGNTDLLNKLENLC